MSSDKTDSYRVSFTYYFSPSSQHNANWADRISISLFPPPVCVLGVIQLILLFCSSLIFFFYASVSSITLQNKIIPSTAWKKKFITFLPSDSALSIFSKQRNAECFHKLWWMRPENAASAGPTAGSDRWFKSLSEAEDKPLTAASILRLDVHAVSH